MLAIRLSSWPSAIGFEVKSKSICCIVSFWPALISWKTHTANPPRTNRTSRKIRGARFLLTVLLAEAVMPSTALTTWDLSSEVGLARWILL